MISACRRILAITALAFGVLASGCALHGFNVNDSQLRYASELPAGISFAWRQGTKVWLVAAKGVRLSTATSALGMPLAAKNDGPYFSIEPAPEEFRVQINSAVRTLRIPF